MFERTENLLPALQKIAPAGVDPRRLQRIVINALRETPKLRECDPTSFITCVLQATALGLEVNSPLKQAYLIPRKNRDRGTLECTLQLDYRGEMDLARRSKEITKIFARCVYKGDDFDHSFGLNETLTHKPRGSDVAAEITHVYAYAKLVNGESVFVVLTRAQVEGRRARSKMRSGGAWASDYAAMCMKTAIHALFPWLPRTTDLGLAHAVDEQDMGLKGSLTPDITDALQDQGLDPSMEVGGETDGGDTGGSDGGSSGAGD